MAKRKAKRGGRAADALAAVPSISTGAGEEAGAARYGTVSSPVPVPVPAPTPAPPVAAAPVSKVAAPSVAAAAGRRAAARRRLLGGWWGVLLIIAAVGLALRLLHVSRLVYSPTGDQVVYPAYGEMWWYSLTGGQLGEADKYLTTRNPPGYALLVAAVRHVFGMEAFRPVYVIQAFLDAATVVLMGLSARFLFGLRAGLLAATVYALYEMAVLYTAQLQTETLALFLIMVSVTCFLGGVGARDGRAERLARDGARRAAWRGGRGWWRIAGSGLALAAAAHVRLNVLALLPVFCGYLMWRGWSAPVPEREPGAAGDPVPAWRGWLARTTAVPARRAALRCLVLAAAVFLPLAPVSVRNSRIMGKPVLVCGSNAERFLIGNNPNSRGEWVGEEALPKEWEAKLKGLAPGEKDRVAKGLAADFLYRTHPAYYFFTVVPHKMAGLMWAPHWLYVGQHTGNSMQYPFGPRFWFPLCTSGMVAAAGLAGFVFRGRRGVAPWFAPAAWGALFFTIQFLIVEARYRLPAELFLMLAAGAALDRLWFRRNFRARFAAAAAALTAVSLGWTALAAARFGGPNLLAKPAVLANQPALKAAVGEGYTWRRDPKPGLTEESVLLGRVPVDPGKCPHLAFRFDFTLERPADMRANYDAWGDAWPDVMAQWAAFDEKGEVLSRDNMLMNAAELNNFMTGGGSQWRVVELHGRTREIQISLKLNRAGTVRISHLEARGPVWTRAD